MVVRPLENARAEIVRQGPVRFIDVHHIFYEISRCMFAICLQVIHARKG